MADFPEFVISLSHNTSNSNLVTVAFTFGLKAQEKGYRTAIILLVDAVHVGRTGYVDDIDIGEPFLPVKDMMEVFLSHGGQLMVCGSCWKHNRLADAERLPGTVMVTADQVIDYLMNAKSTLQLN